MMEQYKAWYTHYIVDIWKGHERKFPGVPGMQVEIGWRSPVVAPDHYAARNVEARAWLNLRTIHDVASAQASCVSIHRRWLKEVGEEITGEWIEARTLDYEADRLARLVSQHDIFDHEKDSCQSVVKALREYAAALRFLIEAERTAYEVVKGC